MRGKKMKEMHLLGKLVKIEECPLLLDYKPDGDFQKYFKVMAGEWSVCDG